MSIFFIFHEEFDCFPILHRPRNIFYCLLTLSQTIPDFYLSTNEGFWKHCGKGENAGYQHFYPFLTMFFFLMNDRNYQLRNINLVISNAFSLDQSKILSFGKKLTFCHTIKALENSVGKGENILSFSHRVFYSIKERNCHFSNI